MLLASSREEEQIWHLQKKNKKPWSRQRTFYIFFPLYSDCNNDFLRPIKMLRLGFWERVVVEKDQ